jgi:chorismate mutase
MGMTEAQDNAALEREEIVARVARFKATQEKFEREREEYFVTTLENARHSEGPRQSFERPSFWS